MEDFEDIEFKPLDSGLGFHRKCHSEREARRIVAEKGKNTFPLSTEKGGGDIFPSRAGSVADARSGKYLPPSQLRVHVNISPFFPADARNSSIKLFFTDQLLIFSIFSVLCSIPLIQFRLLKQPLAPLLQTPILASFGILLAVVEIFYYLFFKQFKLPSPGKWIIERKLKP